MTGPDDAGRLGFDYAWGWFVLHSGQRMNLVNFWLVVVGFITAALATALTTGSHGPASLIAGTGVMVTVAFRRLDRRTRVLVDIAERALAVYENQLADELDTDTVRLIAAAERSKTPHGSYRFVFGALQACAATAFAAVGIACLAAQLGALP